MARIAAAVSLIALMAAGLSSVRTRVSIRREVTSQASIQLADGSESNGGKGGKGSKISCVA